MAFSKNMSDTSSSTSTSSAATIPDVFQKLVEDLSAVLGPSSGLDSEDVDPMDIQRLMEGYVSNEDEWQQYALSDGSRSYTRNLVDEGNGKSNLVKSTLHQAPPLKNIMLILCVFLVLFVAHPGLESQSGQCNPRPCQCSLRHEGIYYLLVCFTEVLHT